MSVGFNVGVLGETQGYLVNPIGPNDPSSASAGSANQSFSLAEPQSLEGEYVCCGGSSYPAGEAVARSLSIYFDYLDTTFVVPSGNLAGSHTIRLIYTNKTFSNGVSALKGDKMYKSSDSFVFCTEASCGATERPDGALVDEIAQTRTGANPNYAYFSVSVTDPFSFTRDEAEQGNWSFELDFDMTGGAAFEQDPNTLTTIAELVSSFTVNSKPGDSGSSGQTSFSVNASKSSSL